MSTTISVTTLRNEMRSIVDRVRKGEDFTVLYRNRAAFRIVSMEADFDPDQAETDRLHGAAAVGRSSEGLSAADHDRTLYGEPGG